LSLKKAKNDPKVMWGLADQALGKDRPSLPASVTGVDGNTTTTPLEATKAVNRFFVDKVDALCVKALLPRVDAPDFSREVPDVTGDVPDNRQEVCDNPQEVSNNPQKVSDNRQEVDNDDTSQRCVPKFYFKFLNAKRISKRIKGLNNTEALGMDGIPTSVLKKGVEVPARPISHLVNWSMAGGRVPAAYKIGRVHPIHKGKGKPRKDPASLHPVSILLALSKVLESHVKDNLEEHLRKVNGLPPKKVLHLCAGSRAGGLAVGSSRRQSHWLYGLQLKHHV
jgi:hypothetical protein